MEYTIEKLEKMQEGRDTLDKLAHTAAMSDDWQLRVACANLLAYGWTTMRLDPTDNSEWQAKENKRAEYLDRLGLDRTYGQDDRDVYRYHFDRDTTDLASIAESADLLDVKEAADILGVSRQRVHQLIQSGHLDGRKVGKTWYIFRQSVEKRMQD